MNDLTSVFRDITNEINLAKNIIIISHENADGDALGSSLALREYLQLKGKTVHIVYHNSPAFSLNFLPGASEVCIFADTDPNIFAEADLAILVDVNSFNRIGTVAPAFSAMKCRKIMLDHHHNPEKMADLYAIDADASATGEIIYRLIIADNPDYLNTVIALCIYVAILTDTGGFRFGNTTSETHKIAADLLSFGIDTQVIYDNLYNAMPHNIFVMLGRTLASSRLYLDGQLNIMTISRNDLINLKVFPEDLNNFSEKSLMIDGTNVGILITEMIKEDGFKMSFRSKGELDIRQVALTYGGGGHRNAAGAKAYNIDIEALIADLVQKTRCLLKNV